jgi:undecaprenyl-phosphate 4-deoxy-4-formamido-L-arabinose transferase
MRMMMPDTTLPVPSLPQPAAGYTLPAGLSAVVPVYNSEQTLDDLLNRLTPVLRSLTPNFEVILVNDGSRDGSWRVIQSLAEQYPFVTGIEMMRNYGQHNALLCGIRAARFDKIVTLDDDLQNPPEEIAKLLAKLNEGFDVVYGKPQAMTHGLLRNLASQITKIVLQQAMGAQTARNISAFRIFRTVVRDAFATYRSPYVSIDVLLTWGTTKFTATEVKHDPRTVGASNYTIRKLLTHAFNMVTGFSTWPLQMASLIGFVFTLVGLFLLLFVFGSWIVWGRRQPGFYFLTSIIAIFSGAQMFALGIMGEYLARLHFRTMDRPTYAVRSQLSAKAEEVSA